MLKSKKGQKGFTLVELMVVMAILAVLAGIVIPAVTGTKTASTDTRLKSDLQNMQTAVNKFTSDSTKGESPESLFDDSGDWGLTTAEITALSAVSIIGATSTNITAGTGASYYTAVNFDDTTKVLTSSGQEVTLTFVPDYLNKLPGSAEEKSSTSTDKRDYLWLLKIGTSTDVPNRVAELYKWDSDLTQYVQVK
ncbi:MAG: prepilin-type N-terminal cleavage/methylation domain-containing protein [Chloroflexi bacterium]|nr:prepilin-type N-terminal cleavage/methylation domain-containing protein [Chloroflexota bacterium]